MQYVQYILCTMVHKLELGRVGHFKLSQKIYSCSKPCFSNLDKNSPDPVTDVHGLRLHWVTQVWIFQEKIFSSLLFKHLALNFRTSKTLNS